MAARNSPDQDNGVCLSMHQPWASLLVYGIKRIEGRGWTADHRGKLWIAATAKQPTPEEIQEMEAFYREVHSMGGGKGGGSLEFPPAYPTGVLLGCVTVADVIKAEQVEAWEGLPEGLKAEVGSPVCFLCQDPQRLVVPQQMRGWPKLFDLPKKVHAVAKLGLKPAPNSRGFSWAAFGSPPPADAALPPSQNKHKYQQLQQQMDAARAATEGSSKASKSESCQSPRAATSAAAGLPRAVPLQQQAQQQPQQQEHQQPADPQKRLRAVQKKLRQIAALQEKLAAGQVLLPEEAAKLQQREAEAAQLQAQVG